MKKFLILISVFLFVGIANASVTVKVDDFYKENNKNFVKVKISGLEPEDLLHLQYKFKLKETDHVMTDKAQVRYSDIFNSYFVDEVEDFNPNVFSLISIDIKTFKDYFSIDNDIHAEGTGPLLEVMIVGPDKVYDGIKRHDYYARVYPYGTDDGYLWTVIHDKKSGEKYCTRAVKLKDTNGPLKDKVDRKVVMGSDEYYERTINILGSGGNMYYECDAHDKPTSEKKEFDVIFDVRSYSLQTFYYTKSLGLVKSEPIEEEYYIYDFIDYDYIRNDDSITFEVLEVKDTDNIEARFRLNFGGIQGVKYAMLTCSFGEEVYSIGKWIRGENSNGFDVDLSGYTYFNTCQVHIMTNSDLFIAGKEKSFDKIELKVKTLKPVIYGPNRILLKGEMNKDLPYFYSFKVYDYLRNIACCTDLKLGKTMGFSTEFETSKDFNLYKCGTHDKCKFNFNPGKDYAIKSYVYTAEDGTVAGNSMRYSFDDEDYEITPQAQEPDYQLFSVSDNPLSGYNCLNDICVKEIETTENSVKFDIDAIIYRDKIYNIGVRCIDKDGKEYEDSEYTTGYKQEISIDGLRSDMKYRCTPYILTKGFLNIKSVKKGSSMYIETKEKELQLYVEDICKTKYGTSFLISVFGWEPNKESVVIRLLYIKSGMQYNEFTPFLNLSKDTLYGSYMRNVTDSKCIPTKPYQVAFTIDNSQVSAGKFNMFPQAYISGNQSQTMITGETQRYKDSNGEMQIKLVTSGREFYITRENVVEPKITQTTQTDTANVGGKDNAYSPKISTQCPTLQGQTGSKWTHLIAGIVPNGLPFYSYFKVYDPIMDKTYCTMGVYNSNTRATSFGTNISIHDLTATLQVCKIVNGRPVPDNTRSQRFHMVLGRNYYIRAVAKNKHGYGWGKKVIFNTRSLCSGEVISPPINPSNTPLYKKMIEYNQGDPLWAKTYLNWKCTYANCGSSYWGCRKQLGPVGCGTTALASIIRYWDSYNSSVRVKWDNAHNTMSRIREFNDPYSSGVPNPYNVVYYTNMKNAISSNCSIGWDHDRLKNMLWNLGLDMKLLEGREITDLNYLHEKYTSKGIPVMLFCSSLSKLTGSQHYVVLAGRSGDYFAIISSTSGHALWQTRYEVQKCFWQKNANSLEHPFVIAPFGQL